MADTQKFLQTQSYALAGSGCTIGATSITLKSMLDIDGVAVAMTDIGTKGWMTLEAGNGAREEQISFTGITQNANGTATLTGVKNVLFKSPYTETSGTVKSHPGGSQAIISNTAGFYDALAGKNNDETVTGTWTFSTTPTITNAPVADEDAANKAYIDGVAIAGAAKATEGVYGITKLSVAAVSATDPIAVGTNDTRVPTQDENNALVGTSGTAVSASNKLVDNADTSGTGSLKRASLLDNSYFGTGADGSVTISSDTTLSKDMYYSDLTVNNTKSLNTANYRIFVSGTLTVNGTIKNNGTNGNNGNPGGNSTGGYYGGGGGGGGSSGLGGGIVAIYAKSIIIGSTGVIQSIGGVGGNGGNGGNGSSNGGAGSAGLGGAGGASISAVSGATIAGTVASGAGASGANGGGVGSPSTGGTASKAATLINSIGVIGAIGGSGGASGGTAYTVTPDTASIISKPDLLPYIPQFAVSLHTFRNSSSSYMVGSAQGNGGCGGSGAKGESSTTGNGGGGGGGGAGGTGGVIVMLYKTILNDGSITTTGGAGGTGGVGGAGTSNGSNGGNGATGTTGIIYQISI
jgi:hypothetical protein